MCNYLMLYVITVLWHYCKDFHYDDDELLNCNALFDKTVFFLAGSLLEYIMEITCYTLLFLSQKVTLHSERLDVVEISQGENATN